MNGNFKGTAHVIVTLHGLFGHSLAPVGPEPRSGTQPSSYEPYSHCGLPFFLADEVKVRADAQGIDQHCDYIPDDHRSRSN